MGTRLKWMDEGNRFSTAYLKSITSMRLSVTWSGDTYKANCFKHSTYLHVKDLEEAKIMAEKVMLGLLNRATEELGGKR